MWDYNLKMKKVLFAIIFLSLVLTACSLASDLTPPPGYHPTAVSQPTAVPVVYPLVPPDPSQGAAIFTDKCTPCHGDTGMGDGPKASQLPNPVGAIGTATVARQAKPMTWYNVVTDGRVERFMPPFASLTDRQRWDVIAYVYTLSVPSAVLQQGLDVYTTGCLSCHGATGRGDGPKASDSGSKVPDWSDSSRLAQRSAQDLYNVTTNGVAPDMPGYATQLSDDQRWAVSAYIRSLSFAGNGGNITSGNPAGAANSAKIVTTAPTVAVAQNITPAPTGGAQNTNPAATAVPPNSTPAAQDTVAPAGTPVSGATAVAQGTVSASTSSTVVTGKVNINGKVTYTAGGTMPSGLNATLLGYDNMSQVTSASAPVNPDGAFSFPNVDVITGRVWLAQVLYNKVPFSSPPLHDTDIKPGQDAVLAITISESSTDASVLSAQRLHIFFDFSTAGTLQVAELFIIQNNTNNAVVSADPAHPALQFELPPGAVNLSFQDGTLGDGRYVQTTNGFGDTQAVPPQGSVQVLFAYEMPYTNNTANLSVPVPMPVDSAVVMVPAGGVNVAGPQVTASGTRDVQGSGTIAMFTASNLTRGSKLDLTVSGEPQSQPAAAGATSAANTNSPIALVIGLAVFGVALAGGGFWFFRQRRAAAAATTDGEYIEPEPVETTESILDAIVALDDLYQAGELPEEAYKERRAELKTRLKELRG